MTTATTITPAAKDINPMWKQRADGRRTFVPKFLEDTKPVRDDSRTSITYDARRKLYSGEIDGEEIGVVTENRMLVVLTAEYNRSFAETKALMDAAKAAAPAAPEAVAPKVGAAAKAGSAPSGAYADEKKPVYWKWTPEMLAGVRDHAGKQSDPRWAAVAGWSDDEIVSIIGKRWEVAACVAMIEKSARFKASSKT